MQNQLTPEKLQSYITNLESRREGIAKNIDKLYSEKIPINKQTAETTSDKIKVLNEVNKKDPFIDRKMQGEVQSYDLLQNEKYGRLDELKKVLDQSVLNKATSANRKSVASENRV